MGKKCNNCGFSDNPENANFCGKCGNKLSLYDKYVYDDMLINRIKYYNYKILKEKKKKTFFQRIVDRIVDWFIHN